MAAVNIVKTTVAIILGAAECGAVNRLDDVLRKKIKKASLPSETGSAVPAGMTQPQLQKLSLNLNANTAGQHRRAMDSSAVIDVARTSENTQFSSKAVGQTENMPVRVGAVGQVQSAQATSKRHSVAQVEKQPEALNPHGAQRLSGTQSTKGTVRPRQEGYALGAVGNIPSPRMTNAGHVNTVDTSQAGSPVSAGAARPPGPTISDTDNPLLAGQQKEPLATEASIVDDRDKSGIPLMGNEHQRAQSHFGHQGNNVLKELAPLQPKPDVTVTSNALAAEPSQGNRLTYSFSDWGKGHQVNIQLATNSAAPLVLHPSDTLVQQRLVDHSGQDKQANPEWVFSDEQESQKEPRQHPQWDEEQE